MANTPQHPGPWLRETYLAPRKINVTEAAKLIGISRSGVSNFLNGRVSATDHMAARIEVAFSIPKATLLKMQAEHDAVAAATVGAPSGTKRYVPPFLAIKANEIVTWADHNISARIRLSVLLRTLVHSTGAGLERVDFLGNDDAERPGWDGFTSALAGTAWVPAGGSGWEFGVTQDVKGKANGDFAKSVKSHKPAERKNITFIFATPRRWPGKDEWVKEMRSKNLWKDVRAYDASDLEQWLEQSPSAQAWFAGETLRPSHGARSLDKAWEDWSGVANPSLAPELFATATESAVPKLKAFLAKQTGAPFVISADSVEEALALLAQAFGDAELLADRDRVLIFDQTGTLPKLAQGTQDFIAVVHMRDVERELGPLVHKLRSIVIYPRNATNEDPDITLEPVGYEVFQKGLEAMGLERDDIKRLEHESGHSLTVLRRRLAKVEGVRTPGWASDPHLAALLVPLVLVGAWNSSNVSDKEAVSLLTGGTLSYDEIERRLQNLLRVNDSPVWSVGIYRGVISKIDALFAIAYAITLADLERFLDVARIVLSEDDPSLDIPEKDRWWANAQGKRREFSGALRSGFGETLVLLAVHGKHLFGSRFGFDGALQADRLVRDVLLPLTTRKLEANDRDLPVYAEASPHAFLKILEDDLREDSPEVFGLLRPVDHGLLGGRIVRTGLLWALEGLAWSKETFLRTVLVLGRLSEVELKDNWSNKPINSLGGIFRSWMPQTTAPHDERVRAVAKLMERYPLAGWSVVTGQFGTYGNDIGHYSHKPKWRPDGYGAGQPFKMTGPAYEFQKAMVEMALSQPSYTAAMICDLIERLHVLGADYQKRVWDILTAWLATKPYDYDIAAVREKIRVTVLSRRGRKRGSAADFAALTVTARKVFDSLEPADVVSKHEWLFRQSWVEESADEREEADLDFRARDKRIEKLRIDALRAVYENRGLDGIFALAEKGSAQGQIGANFIQHVLGKEGRATFIIEALRPGTDRLSNERQNLVFGSLRGVPLADREELMSAVLGDLEEPDRVRVLLLAQYEPATWSYVDALSAKAQADYWQAVHPTWIWETEDNNNESIERLLRAKRPRAAFAAMHLKLAAVRPALLVEILRGIAQGGNDKPGEYQLSSHDLVEAFALLDGNPDVTFDEKAGLEFAYIDVLTKAFGRNKHKIINLERYVEIHPEMWVQALAWSTRRKSGGEDPPEYMLPEGRHDLSQKGYYLLDRMQRIPGHDANNELSRAELSAWVAIVRETSGLIDRLDICDIYLGHLFAHAPRGDDGVWPCEPVRDVMEELQSEKIFEGAHTGLYNLRGVHSRGEGGGQERELADKYRGWADALQFTHPMLSSSLLMELVKTYQWEANQHDTEAGVRRRLRH